MDHPDALSLREMLGRTHPSEESGQEDDAGTGSDQESEEENMCADKESRSEENSSEENSSEEVSRKNIECKKTFSLKELLAPRIRSLIHYFIFRTLY